MNILTTSLDYCYQIFFRDSSLHTGDMVEGEGCCLHFRRSGSKKGNPTIIVETGIYDCSLSWQLVQSKVSNFAEVITYDRAGYGFSKLSAKPRTFEQITRELNEALNKLKLEPPYILVGHSLGGALVRAYQNRYPDDVAGMVLGDVFKFRMT